MEIQHHLIPNQQKNKTKNKKNINMKNNYQYDQNKVHIGNVKDKNIKNLFNQAC